jgi:hypothetical protein
MQGGVPEQSVGKFEKKYVSNSSQVVAGELAKWLMK